jgi:hypothetical protein
MKNVISLHKTIPRTFTAQVRHVDGVWIGVIDALGVVTEADTYEAMYENVWRLAAEMAQENGVEIATDNLRIKFVQSETRLSKTNQLKMSYAGIAKGAWGSTLDEVEATIRNTRNSWAR